MAKSTTSKTTGGRKGYPASLTWDKGEQAKFAQKIFEDKSFSFYVDQSTLAKCRERPASVSKKEWKAMFDDAGYAAEVGVAYGPPELALAYLAAHVKKHSDSYTPWASALARFGVDVLPLVLAQAKAHPSQALDDIAPVDAAELAPIVAGVLASREGSKVKSKASAWLLRHPAAAEAGLASADPAAAAAARKVLGTGARKGASKAPRAPAFVHAGWVYYRSHRNTPLVLGDLEGVRAWEGTDEPSDDLALVKLGRRSIVTHSLDMLAPDVFVSASGGTVVLLAERGLEKSLAKKYVDEDISKFLGAPLERTFGKIDVPVSSGALVVAVAYDAAKRLPKKPPKAPLYAESHVVIPVSPGTYALVAGETKHGYKTVLTRKATRR